MISPVLIAEPARRWLITALLLATAVRGYLLWQYYCINSDGVLYIRAAQDFFAGNFSAGFQSLYPPGYPILIAASYPLIHDWELAGQLLSLLCGVGLLVPVYWIFREMFNTKIALIACYLAALNPFLALYSVHVRSESSYLLLSTIVFYLFFIAIERRDLSKFFIAGLLAGCAYLIRPEALGFLLIVPAVLVLRCFMWRQPNIADLLRSIVTLSIGFLIIALPYIVYLSVDTGRIGAITRKAGLTLAINLHESGLLENGGDTQESDVGSFVFTDFVLKHPFSYIKKVASDLIPAIWIFIQALYYSYLPFLLVGLFAAYRKHILTRRHLLLIGFVLFYIFGFAFIYVKRRYALQAVPLSLAWVALGMAFLWEQMRERLTHRRARIAAACIGLIFFASTLPITLRSVSREKAFVRQAGWYLKARNPSGNLNVAVLDGRVAFYAGARAIPLTKVDTLSITSFLHDQKANYLAAEAKTFAKMFPEVSRQPEHFGLILEQDFKGIRKDRMLLFKVS